MDRRTYCRRLGSLGGIGLGSGLAGCLEGASPRDDGNDGISDTTNDQWSDQDVMSSDPTDWPTFGADQGHTGFHPEGVGPASGAIAWSAIGDAPTVLCSPTVTDGTVYVGSAADAIHAFDAETGETEWEFPTTKYVETAATVAGDRVYAADADGVVYAVSTDGVEDWRHETGHNLHSRALAVRDGTVYVGTAGTMPAVVSGETDESKAGKVVALDAENGSERWSFQGPEDWFSGPAVGGGRVYVGNHTGAVFALGTESGEEVWSWIPSGEEHVENAAALSPPTYSDGTVYVGLHAAGWVVALDAASGAVRWRTNLEAENVKSSPAVTDERVYVGATRIRAVPLGGAEDDGDTQATETPTGTPTPEAGTYGRLYALSRADGDPVWIHETDHDFRSSPAVVGDRVYVGGGDGALAVTRADGSEVWRVSFDGFVESSPAVAEGRLYIGSADGNLYCIGDG